MEQDGICLENLSETKTVCSDDAMKENSKRKQILADDAPNCVQTFLGLEVLHYSLMDLGLTDKPNIVSRFEEMFKQMWQSNGNELSKMYAGTGALGASHKLIDGARSAARTIQVSK